MLKHKQETSPKHWCYKELEKHMYRTLYSLTFWVKYHRCWLVLRECLYRHTKVLLASCFFFFFLLLFSFNKSSYWTNICLHLHHQHVWPFWPSLPFSCVFPGANSTAESSLVPFRLICLWCVQGPSASGGSSLWRMSYRSTLSHLSLSPDHTGYTGLPGQQRQHGIVGVGLVQALLARRLGLRPLSVDERHGDVAVGVLVA